MSRMFSFLALLLILGQPAISYSDESRDALSKLEKNVHRYVLSNGLRVLMYRRGVAPVFAGSVTVEVGGVDESPGSTGISHVLEHMAFKGTDKIGTKNYAREKVLLQRLEELVDPDTGNPRAQDEDEWKKIHDELRTYWEPDRLDAEFSRHGASGLNATTAKELTNFFVNLPRNAFEFWCWMESERLLHPVMRQFYQERDVVLEERRMRFDDDPAGKLYEQLLGVAYLQHPYRYPVIGYESDVRRLNATQVSNFQKRYYVPGNMVVSLVGDINPESDIKIVERYFGKIAPGTNPTRTNSVEPPPDGEHQLIVRAAAAPQLMVAYHKPAYPHPDDAPLSVMNEVLAGSTISPVYAELVKRRQIAASVGHYEAPGSAYPNLIVFNATARSPHTNDDVLDGFDEIITKFQRSFSSQADLDIAKRAISVSYLGELASNMSLALDLASAELTYNDWKAVIRWYEEVGRVTVDDIRRVSRQYLRNDNRVIARLESRDRTNTETARDTATARETVTERAK